MNRFILFFLLCFLSTAFFAQIPEVAINQCISLDKPIYCDKPALNWSNYAALSDGDDESILEVASPVTIALQVDAQSSTADSLILHWRTQSWQNRDSNIAALKHFEIYTSINSTNGVDGDWTFIKEGTSIYKDNFIFFPNTQPKWVKIKELETDTLKLARLEVFQSAPPGKKNDIWMFFGDSQTLLCMGGGRTNYEAPTRFGNQIHINNPCYYPMIINGGVGGEKATEAVIKLNQILEDMPQISFMACAYGINDVMFSLPPLVPYDDPINDNTTAIFLNAYVEILDICKANDVFPIPARIPWVHFPNHYFKDYTDTTQDKTNGITPINLNEIDTLIKLHAPYAIDPTTNIPFADFDTWFREHRHDDLVYQFDSVHLAKVGIDRFNKVWVNTAEQIIYANKTCDTTGEINLVCPENIFIELDNQATEIPVNWTSPIGTTTCGKGASILLTQVLGAPMGSALGIGNYYIGYEASDYCGETEACRFSITINPAPIPFDCSDIPGFSKMGVLNGNGYYLSENAQNWKDGRNIATSMGGHLATIQSNTENTLIQNALNQETAYIGIYDFLEEGKPEWVTGETISIDFVQDNTVENDYGLINFWAGTWGFVNQWVNQKMVMEKKCALMDLTLNCPDNISVMLPQNQTDTALVWSQPSATTVCTNEGILLTQIAGSSSGTVLEIGDYEYSWNALDSCNNISTCSWMVQVVPFVNTGSITFNCLEDIVVSLPVGQTDTVLAWTPPTGLTTCSISDALTVDQTTGLEPGSTFLSGVYTVNYTAMDSCENTENCTFQILIDTTEMMGVLSLDCPDDINIEIPIGQMDTLVFWEEPTLSTTCNLNMDVTLTQTQGFISGSTIPIGNTLIVYVGQDECNNIDTCSFSITTSLEPDATELLPQGDGLYIFPNPVKDLMNVQWDTSSDQLATIKVFSAQGVLVFSRKQMSLHKSIDVSLLPPSLYFIQISSLGQDRWAKFIKL